MVNVPGGKSEKKRLGVLRPMAPRPYGGLGPAKEEPERSQCMDRTVVQKSKRLWINTRKRGDNHVKALERPLRDVGEERGVEGDK